MSTPTLRTAACGALLLGACALVLLFPAAAAPSAAYAATQTRVLGSAVTAVPFTGSAVQRAVPPAAGPVAALPARSPLRAAPQAPAPWGSLGAAVPLAAVAVVGALVAAVWRMVSRPVAQTPVDPIDLLRPADRLATWTAEEDTESWAFAAAAAVSVLPQRTAVVPVREVSGATVGNAELCLRTAGINSRHVIHRKLVAEFANRRQSNAHTKTRAEVSGGGRKPYKQKGSGNARRGSNRSPLMRKGGVAFGPRNTKNYKQKINRKEGRLAISSLLQNRAPLLTVVKGMEGMMGGAISTKRAAEIINGWKDPAKGDKVLMVIDTQEEAAAPAAEGAATADEKVPRRRQVVKDKWPAKHPLVLSTNNLPMVRVISQRYLSVADLLWPHQIFVSDGALGRLQTRFEVPESPEAAPKA